MDWRDEGIVLGVRRQGETGVVLDLLTQKRGRHSGLVFGGRSSRLQPVLQPGNSVCVVWRARLEENLGVYTVEGVSLRTAQMIGSPIALYGVSSVSALAHLLPERDPCPATYQALVEFVEALHDPLLTAARLILFELALLADLGFGLDLSVCAATGVREGLVYVSPKSGRAVSAEAGEPYKNKLFRLPAFLREKNIEKTLLKNDAFDGLILTQHFLKQRIFLPQNQALPNCRESITKYFSSNISY